MEWFANTSNNEGLPFTFKGAQIFLENAEDKTIEDLVAVSPWAGSESHDVNYIEKINMQGVIQKWIDHSISVTHNLPTTVSLEEVNKIYFHAWKV